MYPNTRHCSTNTGVLVFVLVCICNSLRMAPWRRNLQWCCRTYVVCIILVNETDCKNNVWNGSCRVELRVGLYYQQCKRQCLIYIQGENRKFFWKQDERAHRLFVIGEHKFRDSRCEITEGVLRDTCTAGS